MSPDLRFLDIEALGVPIRLHVKAEPDTAASILDELRHTWQLCTTKGQPPTRHLLIWLSDDLAQDPPHGFDGLAQHRNLPHLLQIATQQITRLAILGNAGRYLMLHAAGLAHPVTGDAVAFVAAGGTGKTTLCRTLGPKWAYLTDETVAMDQSDQIVPYPKPLSIREPHRNAKYETAPTDLGLKVPTVPARLRSIVFLERQPDWAGPIQVTDLPVFDAIVELTPQSSSLNRLPRPLHLLAELHDRLDRVSKVVYGEAATLEPFIADLIGAAR